MALASQLLEKQPSEVRNYTMDFTNLLGTSETISSTPTVTAVIADGSASDLGISSVTYGTGLVNFDVASGTDGNNYIVTVLLSTSAGNTLEGDGPLRVRD